MGKQRWFDPMMGFCEGLLAQNVGTYGRPLGVGHPDLLGGPQSVRRDLANTYVPHGHPRPPAGLFRRPGR